MSRPIHALAREQARKLVELFWHELPEEWTTGPVAETNQFGLELWLACFDMKVKSQKPGHFALLRAVRHRAQTYYQEEFKQVHHDAKTWAFFRFRLELACLNTIGADYATLDSCYQYHDITAGFAHRIDYEGAERLRPGSACLTAKPARTPYPFSPN